MQPWGAGLLAAVTPFFAIQPATDSTSMDPRLCAATCAVNLAHAQPPSGLALICACTRQPFEIQFGGPAGRQHVWTHAHVGAAVCRKTFAVVLEKVV